MREFTRGALPSLCGPVQFCWSRSESWRQRLWPRARRRKRRCMGGHANPGGTPSTRRMATATDAFQTAIDREAARCRALTPRAATLNGSRDAPVSRWPTRRRLPRYYDGYHCSPDFVGRNPWVRKWARCRRPLEFRPKIAGWNRPLRRPGPGRRFVWQRKQRSFPRHCGQLVIVFVSLLPSESLWLTDFVWQPSS